MIYDKTAETRWIKMQVFAKPIGYQNHERVACSEKAKADFDKIMEDTIAFMVGRIRNWENQYEEKLKGVGR